jgi:hypothetical protein
MGLRGEFKEIVMIIVYFFLGMITAAVIIQLVKSWLPQK